MQKYQPFEGDRYKICDVYFMDVILLRRIKNRVSFDFLKIYFTSYLFCDQSIFLSIIFSNYSSQFTYNFYQNNLIYLKNLIEKSVIK